VSARGEEEEAGWGTHTPASDRTGVAKSSLAMVLARVPAVEP
jgi:hypothetical protein